MIHVDETQTTTTKPNKVKTNKLKMNARAMNDSRMNIHFHDCDVRYIDSSDTHESSEIKKLDCYCKICINLQKRVERVRVIISNLEKAKAPRAAICLAAKDIIRMRAAINNFEV